MFNIFKKKSTFWKVTFKDSKGATQAASIKAESRLDAYYESKRIFKNADFIDAIIE